MKGIRASVTAALFTTDSRLVLQLRDNFAGIEYPGYWSLISGWIEIGESPSEALRREIDEELTDGSGAPIRYRNLRYQWCCNRMDRPWCEYFFTATVETLEDNLVIHEGQRVEVFAVESAANLSKFAPHHREFLLRFLDNAKRSDRLSAARDALGHGRMRGMSSVSEHLETWVLGAAKDYAALEDGDGFVTSADGTPTGVIHTRDDAKTIALLKFKQDTARGEHYHLHKVEYMVVLQGRLRCEFYLPGRRSESEVVIMESGQQVRILPGCAHVYTALGGDVLALEYSPQRYVGSDVYDASE
jgi:ADP-ribose pyrophosphatase YjhB (NUDIX family)/mannose-6-phosphate isomerase-like protein (cupin superfamily)